MSDELKITRDGVLLAAMSCPTAKTVLEKLFPDVFRGSKSILGGFKLQMDDENVTLDYNDGDSMALWHILSINLKSGLLTRYSISRTLGFTCDSRGRISDDLPRS